MNRERRKILCRVNILIVVVVEIKKWRFSGTGRFFSFWPSKNPAEYCRHCFSPLQPPVVVVRNGGVARVCTTAKPAPFGMEKKEANESLNEAESMNVGFSFCLLVVCGSALLNRRIQWVYLLECAVCPPGIYL